MASMQSLTSLQRIFPAVRKLGRWLVGKQIPFIPQMEVQDCGAACLAMVLDYHGKEIALAELREATGTTSREGLTALDIKEAAYRYGLRCRAVWLKNAADLEHIEPASILHWITKSGQKHFVVFERLTKNGARIIDPDPAQGRRHVPLDQFNSQFAGTVLLFEPGEEFTPAVGDRVGVWPYMKQVISQSRVLGRILLISALVQAFALALPLLTKVLIDRNGGDYHLLTVLAVGLAAIVLFNALAALIRAHLLLQLRTQLDLQLTLSFVEHLMRLPYAFFQKRSTGDLIMRLNSNATVREVVTSGVLSGFLDGTMVLLYFIILFVVSPLMALIVLGLAILQVSLFVISYPRYRALMTEELSRQARTQGYEVEMLAGIETLKSTASEHRAQETWSNLFIDTMNVTLKRGRLSAHVESVLAALRMASPLTILCVGAALVIEKQMSLGTMFAVNALAGGLLTPLAGVVGTALQFSTVKSYIERIKDVMEAPAEQEPDYAEDEPEPTRLGLQLAEQKRRPKPDAPPLRGRVTLEHISFRYGPPHQPLVVKNVSVDIEPGQHVAIIGRSGSGKSTLARLLVGLYTPTEGRILYDGADLAQFNFRSVRKQMGLVSQDPYLFAASIRDNIALTDPELALAEVERAARLAHIHDEIAAMPSGYDTTLIEGGMSLSGGQRQRLALARALVHRPRILVLDEATSDLDTVNESAIQKELESLSCTSIVIAHRLSTIVHADLILVMMDGQVVESGTHQELMTRGGEYAALIAAQVGHE